MQTRGVFFKPGFDSLQTRVPGFDYVRPAGGRYRLLIPLPLLVEYLSMSEIQDMLKSHHELYCNVGLQLLLLAIIAAQKAQSIQRSVTEVRTNLCTKHPHSRKSALRFGPADLDYYLRATAVPPGTAVARISYGNSVCLSVTTRYGFNAR